MKFVSLCLPFYDVFQNGRVGIWNRKFRSGSRIFHKVFDQRYIDDDVGSFASEASYCFILGLIPFMIFLVNCILFFAAPQLDTILDLLQYLPAQFAASMEENIARIIAGRSTIWLFAGLGGAVWTASQGTAVLVRGMDKIFFRTEISSPGSRSA